MLFQHCYRRSHVPCQSIVIDPLLKPEGRICVTERIYCPLLSEAVGFHAGRFQKTGKRLLEALDHRSIRMAENELVRFRFDSLPSRLRQLVTSKLKDSLEVFFDLPLAGHNLPMAGLPLYREDEIRCPVLSPDLTKIPPLQSTGFPDPQPGISHDEDVVDEHHSISTNFPIVDLHEFPEVTDEPPPVMWAEVRPPRLLRFHPRKLRNCSQIILLNTPIQEVLEVGVYPPDRVG